MEGSEERVSDVKALFFRSVALAPMIEGRPRRAPHTIVAVGLAIATAHGHVFSGAQDPFVGNAITLEVFTALLMMA